MHSKFLAERPARWAPYGQNNFSQRYRTLVEHFSVFLQKWRAKVEVRFLRYCVDPNAPRTGPKSRWMLMAADAQAEADGGDDEAPPDVESDDGSVAGSSPGGSSPPRVPTPLRPAWECGSVEVGGGGASVQVHRLPVSEILLALPLPLALAVAVSGSLIRLSFKKT